MVDKEKTTKSVRDLQRLAIALRGLRFTVAKRKDGTVKVKIRRKLDLITVPSKEWGECIAEELNLVLSRKAGFVEEAILHIQNRVEQLQMELFGKDVDDGKLEGHDLGGEEDGKVGDNPVEPDSSTESKSVREHPEGESDGRDVRGKGEQLDPRRPEAPGYGVSL